MESKLRNPSPTPHPVQSRNRRADGRPRRERVRRLLFEACEPRFVLSVLPVMVPTDDPWIPDEPTWAEVAQDWNEGPSDTAVPEEVIDQTEEAKDPIDEPVPGERARGPTEEGIEWSEDPVWIMLETTPAERALAGSLDATESSHDLAVEEFSSDEAFSFGSDSNGTTESVTLQSAGQDAANRFSVASGVYQGNSKLELERPRWTAMTTVRYPLYNARGSRSVENLASEQRAVASRTASTTEFLDVGQSVISTSPPFHDKLAPWGGADMVFAGKAVMQQAARMSANRVGTQDTGREMADSARPRHPLILTGLSAGHRMLLLTSSDSGGFKTRASSHQRPVADSVLDEDAAEDLEKETTSESGVSTDHADDRHAGIWVPSWPAPNPTPVADEPDSHGTMRAVVCVTLAGLFTAACHSRRQQSKEVPAGWPHNKPPAIAQDAVFAQL